MTATHTALFLLIGLPLLLAAALWLVDWAAQTIAHWADWNR